MRFLKIYLIFITIFFVPKLLGQTPKFSKGVNLSNWFQSSKPQKIPFAKYSIEDFRFIKSLGCDVIRVPINMHAMVIDTISYKIDPILFYFLDKIVDWAEEENINLILDNHSFNPQIPTDSIIVKLLIPVWQQVANHFKNRSGLIYFEILNEPHGIRDKIWNKIQENVITEIRKIDSAHTLIVGPAEWNNYKNLNQMPKYSDPNLIYTFHFYEPFLFTHQGAEWVNPSMEEVKEISFPFDKENISQIPNSFKNTWIESLYKNYSVEGIENSIKKNVDIAIEFAKDRNVEIFCGEFGVLKNVAHKNDRNYWHKVVTEYFNKNNISWTLWDYSGDFGLLNENKTDYEINIPLTKALGFNSDIGFNPNKKSDTVKIYSDFIGKNISELNWLSGGTINFFDDINPTKGKYCISISKIDQFNYAGFEFKKTIDLSDFINEGEITFNFKTDDANSKFDLVFVDSKENSDDNQWKIRYTIDNRIIKNNNSWQKLIIPLGYFSEYGTWENNKWYSPQGKFDWTKVSKFQITNENGSLNNLTIWLDEVEIVKQKSNN
jgi:endoglucanase